jgi:hypothetical protein
MKRNKWDRVVFGYQFVCKHTHYMRSTPAPFLYCAILGRATQPAHTYVQLDGAPNKATRTPSLLLHTMAWHWQRPQL